MSGECGREFTRQEWNAAYYLGLEDVVKPGGRADFKSQIRWGVRRLEAAGYGFEASDPGVGAALSEAGLWGSAEHRKAVRELFEGSFDTVGRAREALGWLRVQVPEIATTWLEGVLSVYDRHHDDGAAPAMGRSPDLASSSGGIRHA